MRLGFWIGVLCCAPLLLFARVTCAPGECIIKRFHLGPDGFSEISHIRGDKNNPAERSPDEVEFVSETPPIKGRFYMDGCAYCPLYDEMDTNTKNRFETRADWPNRNNQNWMRELP